MQLSEFNSNYIYKTDISEHGRVEYWTVMKPDEDGFYYGDCEDYALTVKAKVDGFDDWDLWYCKLSGEGHCILRCGDHVIDNNTKKIVNVDYYKSIYKVSGMKKYNWFVVFSKKLVARMIKLVQKLAFKD
jgi:predicted transglutaminase-like cysteine proteinase